MARVQDSKHLSEIMQNKSGTADAQIVFLDILSYSKRKSTVQKAVVEQLQKDIKKSLNDVGRDNLSYIESNGINFSNDVIVLPTGDGAIIGFTFGGMHKAAIDFATSFLRNTFENAEAEKCEKFSDNSWCNCHSHYKVRIGINEGKVIIFNDMNGLVNIAGNCINDAARVMNKADGSQILMTEIAFISLIDMSDDNTLEEKIVPRGRVRVKHEKELSVYQYIGSGEGYISIETPVFVEMDNIMSENMKKMGCFGHPNING